MRDAIVSLVVLALFVATGSIFSLAFRAFSDCRDQVVPVRLLSGGFESCSHRDHWLSLVEAGPEVLLFCECKERK